MTLCTRMLVVLLVGRYWMLKNVIHSGYSYGSSIAQNNLAKQRTGKNNRRVLNFAIIRREDKGLHEILSRFVSRNLTPT